MNYSEAVEILKSLISKQLSQNMYENDKIKQAINFAISELENPKNFTFTPSFPSLKRNNDSFTDLTIHDFNFPKRKDNSFKDLLVRHDEFSKQNYKAFENIRTTF